MFDATARSAAPAPGAGPAASAGPAPGFHLIDTTMMYAPRSGGVKRYLSAKRTWLERRRPDIRHTLVVPGAVTGLEAAGLFQNAEAEPLGFSKDLDVGIEGSGFAFGDFAADRFDFGVSEAKREGVDGILRLLLDQFEGDGANYQHYPLLHIESG